MSKPAQVTPKKRKQRVVVPARTITFTVLGRPVQQGSVKAIKGPHMKFAQVVHDNSAKLKSWRADVRAAMAQAFGAPPSDAPVSIVVSFSLPRPKSVHRARPTTKPDLDKLVRSLLDAGTGVLWSDDAQVVNIEASKLYSHAPGMDVLADFLEHEAAKEAAE